MKNNTSQRTLGVTRRSALKGLGVAALASTVGPIKIAAAQDHGSVDVIVIGAGASGLMAARTLVKGGQSVVVIEANDRVGGRLKRGEIAGQVIDLGGQWVGPTQTAALELANEFGMKTYATPEFGKNVTEIADEIFTSKGIALPPGVTAEFVAVLGKLGKLMEDIPLADPWNAPNAEALDSVTVRTWMNENIRNSQLQDLFRVVVEAVFSAPPEQISLLEYLFYNASGGSFQEMIGTKGGAQQDLFFGGFHQICTRMAADLGDRVILDSPVRAIEQTDRTITVRADAGTWTAKRVIVSVPPATCGRIEFTPRLPYQREGLQERMPMGTVIKCFLAYDKPFWREDGLSGQVVSSTGAYGVFFDITEPGRKSGVLSGFFDGGPAQEWADRSEDERRAQVIKDVARAFGPKAENPIAYAENNWPREQWSKGGYACIPGPGVLTHFGQALRRPVGRIHWAGTETSEHWCGYVDGALRSGKRAASEILEPMTATA